MESSTRVSTRARTPMNLKFQTVSVTVEAPQGAEMGNIKTSMDKLSPGRYSSHQEYVSDTPRELPFDT